MKRIFLILVLFLSAIFTRTSIAEEISLFDSAGRPIAYISTDDGMTIYMDTALKEYLEQAGFCQIQSHKNKKGWLCVTAQKR